MQKDEQHTTISPSIPHPPSPHATGFIPAVIDHQPSPDGQHYTRMPPVSYRWYLTFNLDPITQPPSKPPVLHRRYLTFRLATTDRPPFQPAPLNSCRLAKISVPAYPQHWILPRRQKVNEPSVVLLTPSSGISYPPSIKTFASFAPWREILNTSSCRRGQGKPIDCIRAQQTGLHSSNSSLVLIAKLPIHHGTHQPKPGALFPKQQDTHVQRHAIIGKFDLDCSVEFEADAWYAELHHGVIFPFANY
jgi:hypothetical protein